MSSPANRVAAGVLLVLVALFCAGMIYWLTVLTQAQATDWEKLFALIIFTLGWFGSGRLAEHLQKDEYIIPFNFVFGIVALVVTLIHGLWTGYYDPSERKE